MKYSYYPGCTLKATAKKLDECARRSAEALGVTLEELPEWQCCGGVYPQAKNEVATRLAAVRALAAARERGQDLVCVCAACYHVLKRANEDLKTDENFRKKANLSLGLETPYCGETRVLHYLELLRDDIGFDRVRAAVAHPLTGEKIGAYYGCMLLRPGKQLKLDDPENPTVMEALIRACGAEPVVYAQRNECCGGYQVLENKALATRRATEIAANARTQGAQSLVTACPLCQYNLSRVASNVPVYYFTELLARALLGE